MLEYLVVNGELRTRKLNLPVHAYIPMYYTPVGMPRPIEDPPVAYLNQMQAKRVADAWRKRAKSHPLPQNTEARTTLLGVTVK